MTNAHNFYTVMNLEKSGGRKNKIHSILFQKQKTPSFNIC